MLIRLQVEQFASAHMQFGNLVLAIMMLFSMIVAFEIRSVGTKHRHRRILNC